MHPLLYYCWKETLNLFPVVIFSFEVKLELFVCHYSSLPHWHINLIESKDTYWMRGERLLSLIQRYNKWNVKPRWEARWLALMAARCSDRLLQRFRKEVVLWALLLLSKEHMESFLLLSWPLRHYEPYNEFRKKALESYWLSSIFRHAIQFPILRILVLTRFPLHNHC